MTAFKLDPAKTPLVILSEGLFGELDSKTGLGVIRYGTWPITAVIDSTCAGQTVRQRTGLACDAPIVASLEETLRLQPAPRAVLVGTAPMGGGLPEGYRQVLKGALEAGLHIISGLHKHLNADPELVELARQKQLILWDVRTPSADNIVATKKPRRDGVKVITMVGSDCAVGKKWTALELTKATREAGHRASFIATGQTGILIEGTGVPLDRVIGDFMAGHVERAIHEAINRDDPEFIFVEGQGSLLHPAYSGVTMSLLHGSNPDALVMCHNATATCIGDQPDVRIPPSTQLVEIYESAASWINNMERKARVIGFSVNTSQLDEFATREFLDRVTLETGLPATDPVKLGVAALLQKLFP